mgnify:CR=1 FL=1
MSAPRVDTFAARLTFARTVRGASMRALAEDAGISVNTVSKLESGETDPRCGTVAALAAALRIRPAWLAFWDGAMVSA